MKRCGNCNEELADSARFCPKCGATVDSYSYATENNDVAVREEAKLRDEYSKRANTAFTLSLVSIALCCCTITSIISLVLSIILMVDLSKMSDVAKGTDEYRKIKNKAIAALIISAILVFLGIINAIDSVVNADQYSQQYEDMINSILGEDSGFNNSSVNDFNHGN